MKPKLAILILSWLRFDVLLETLRQIPTTYFSPVHLILRVQGMERLTEEDRIEVFKAAKGFTTTDIYFTRDNVGSAGARLDLIHRGAKAGYEYLMFTDDDITFPHGGIDYQIHILDNHPEIGSVSLKPGGINKVQVVDESGICLKTYGEVNESLCEVYLIGSASIMFRSELYTKYLVAPDPAYYIGTWDWDFVLQIRETGYKVTVITDKKIINKHGGDEEYRKKRRNKRYVKENRRLFISKWGFDPVKSRMFQNNFTKPVTITDALKRKALDNLEIELPEPEVIKTNHGSVVKGTDWKSRIAN